MGIKSFAQTRWQVDPEAVTLYPYRIFNILSIAFAVIFGAMIIWMGQMLYPNISDAITSMASMYIALALLILFLVGIARTAVVFDNRTQLMQKKLFGIIPIRTEAFDQLEGISIVRNTLGGFNYRAFPKRDKYGKGVVVSASYNKEDDANALALNQQAFKTISQFLAQVYHTGGQEKIHINDFTYYDVNAPYYTIKKNKVFGVLFGLALLAFSINEIINKTTTYDTNVFTRILVISGTFLGGVALVIAAFNKIIFDTSSHTVSQFNSLGIGNQTYNFSDFVSFQITRCSTNLIYTGTDINMYFQLPGASKQKALVLNTFRSTKKIDAFLKETRYIMELNTRQ